MSATATESPAPVGEATVRRRIPSRVPAVAAGVALAAIVVAVCAWPMLSGTGYILHDWYSHLWYAWHQEQSMKAHHGLPSLFANDTSGVFDPRFAFYGGTLYAITGALSLVLGHDAAYVVTWVLAFATAYGAWFWLGRLAGLGRWTAHVPGLVFITSPWYLSSTYVFANWAQTVAFSALLLSLAAAISILRADRLRPGPAVALAVGTLLYTGSHNLTLAWATSLLLILGVALLALVPAARALLTRRGVLRIVAVALPALLVNGWFLLPAVAYQSHTQIAVDVHTAHGLLRQSADYVASGHVFSLTRATADPQLPRFALQLPLLAIGWVLVGLLIARPGPRTPWLRTVLLLLAAMVGTWVLMSRSGIVLGLPHPLDMLQGLYRLQGYLLLALGGALIGVLVLAGRAGPWGRRWTWVLVPVLALAVVQARGQITQPLDGPDLLGPVGEKTPYLTDQSQVGTADYVTADVPLIRPTQDLTFITFPATTAEQTDRVEATVSAKPDELLATNLKVATPLIEISGAHVVARAPNGNAFLKVDAGARGPTKIVVTAAHPWPVVAGRVLTLLGLLGLAAGAVALVATRRRR